MTAAWVRNGDTTRQPAEARLSGGEPPRIEGRSPFRLAMERFRRDKVAMASLGFILVLALFALTAPLLAKATGHPPTTSSSCMR